MAHGIEERRGAVAQVIAEGRWSTHEQARLATEFGVSHRTIDNDRRALVGVRQGVKPRATLHTLPPPEPTTGGEPAVPTSNDISRMTRAEGLGWLLDRMADAVIHGDPGSGAYVAAAKEVRALLAEREEVLERDASKRGNVTPDKLAEELAAKVARLPAPMRRRLAEALAANG